MNQLLILLLLVCATARAQQFTFAVMSDSRGSDNGVNSTVLSTLVHHLVANRPDARFLLFPGDLVDGSKTSPADLESQLLYWKQIMRPVLENRTMDWPRLWLTVGNHEVQNRKGEEIFRRLFPNVFMNGPDDEKGLTYSFDYNNCHFVFVTSDRWYYGDPNDTMDDRRDWHYIKNLDWLENDLKAANRRGVAWTFIMSHEPAFPMGGHLMDALPNLGKNLVLPLDSTRQWYLNQRDRFWHILQEQRVAAYICGHEHLYGRLSVEGVYQIVAGSSGAPLYHFNSRFGDNPEKKRPGQELTYSESLPYYKTLNYFYAEGENCQASRDFVGYRAFEYVVLQVTPDEVRVETIGAFPKEGSMSEMEGPVRLLDSFTIPRRQ